MIFVEIDVAKDTHDYFITTTMEKFFSSPLPSPTTLMGSMNLIRK